MSVEYSLEATIKTPEIMVSSDTSSMEMRGRSLPEDALEFYSNSFEALEMLCSEKEFVTLRFYMEYMNTSSSSVIRAIMELMADKKSYQEVDYKIEWYFEQDDLEMEETGKHFEQTVKDLKITYIPVEAL